MTTLERTRDMLTASLVAAQKEPAQLHEQERQVQRQQVAHEARDQANAALERRAQLGEELPVKLAPGDADIPRSPALGGAPLWSVHLAV